MFDTPVCKNGLTGGKSRLNSKSRLANLVFYIWTSSKYGKVPTQAGFIRAHNGKRMEDLFKLAKATGVIIETGQKIKSAKIIALGPNAQYVKSLHHTLELGI
jgi:hypothetical protein